MRGFLILLRVFLLFFLFLWPDLLAIFQAFGNNQEWSGDYLYAVFNSGNNFNIVIVTDSGFYLHHFGCTFFVHKQHNLIFFLLLWFLIIGRLRCIFWRSALLIFILIFLQIIRI